MTCKSNHYAVYPKLTVLYDIYITIKLEKILNPKIYICIMQNLKHTKGCIQHI